MSVMAIVLQESLRGLFYAPYYAALALGAYEKEGVEVLFGSTVRGYFLLQSGHGH